MGIKLLTEKEMGGVTQDNTPLVGKTGMMLLTKAQMDEPELIEEEMEKAQQLGLFGNEALPKNKDNPLDYLNLLTLKKMSLGDDERDMIVMHHEFIVNYSSKNEYITSTLVDYGIPNNDSAVARTVALPAAIAVKMILNGKINVKGVYIPVIPEIYNPILDELEEIGIKFIEKKKHLD